MTNNTNITKEMKRHMGVLTEHFNEKVDLIAEQHGSIMENIHDIKATLDDHTTILDDHTTQFEIIKNDLEVIKSELRQKVDYKDFEVLEKRVLRLEAKIK